MLEVAKVSSLKLRGSSLFPVQDVEGGNSGGPLILAGHTVGEPLRGLSCKPFCQMAKWV